MEYFVVFIDYGYGPSGADGGSHLEAVVEPALTRSRIVSRIQTREYDNIVQIDRIQFGVNGQRTVTDITKELIDEAEAELDDGEPDEPLPAAVIPPVR